MPLTYNSKSPIRIKYNGNEVRKVKWGASVLPSGYTQLEYLESSGTQYIDTGIKMTTADDVNMLVQFTSETPTQNFYGSRNATSAGTGSWNLFYNVMSGSPSGESRIRLDWNGVSTDFSSTIPLNTDATIRLYSSSVHGRVVVNGTSYLGYIVKTNANYNTVLFGCNNAGEITRTSLRIKEYSVKRGGTLIQNLIPAKRNSDNELGMYDAASGTFFVNAGTGIFIAGPESGGTTVWRLIPEEYTEVEWLQSDGACYIDLNRVPNMDDIVEQKFKKVGTGTSTSAWYGSMPSSSVVQPRFGMGTYTQGLFFGANTTVSFSSDIDTNVHEIRWQCTNLSSGQYVYTLDGEQHTKIGTGSSSDPVTLTSYLFARHGTGGVQTYDNEGTRIYYHKEYLSNGTIQLDLVPCRRVSDGTLGMYDLVAEIFHPGQGSGSFTAGPAIG